MKQVALGVGLLLVGGLSAGFADEAFGPYAVRGDAVPAQLAGRAGDVARGAALIGDRHKSLCVLCHSGPFPDAHLQGDLGPSLAGIGARLTQGQIRLRVIDMKSLNPASIMPSYHRPLVAGRIAVAWRGRPILDAGEVEDLVAYLSSLKD